MRHNISLKSISVAIVAGCLCLSATSCKSKPAGPQWMTIAPAKSSFGAREYVTINITFTNLSNKTCYISGMGSGVFVIDQMTVNGWPVSPEYSSFLVNEGSYSYVLYNSYVAVAPGATGDSGFSAYGGDYFDMDTIGPGSPAALTRWPVQTAGTYALTLHYFVPPLKKFPGELCPIPTDPIMVQFQYTGA
jgi:hypothetical protein